MKAESAGPELVQAIQTPPQSEQVEVSVLGAMLIEDAARRAALERLDPEDFHHEGRRRIFCALGRLNGRGQEGDVVALSEELKSAGELEAAGGMVYLAELVDAVPTTANAKAHINRLQELRTLREIQDVARQAAKSSGNAGPGEAGAVVGEALERLHNLAERTDGDLDARTWDYADMANDPDLLEPPEAVVPRLAFREHMTLLSSDAKGGKTTLAAAGAAAVANGDRLLGQPTRQGTVLWIKGEGHRRMVFRYLHDFGAEPVPGRIAVVESGGDPVTELETLVRRLTPDLVVVDTWTSWTATLGLDYWKAADVAPVLKRLEAVARSGPAVLLLHHNRRSDQQPRGSGHLMAAVDLLRTVEDGSHDRERVVKGRGRVPCDPFRYSLFDADARLHLQLVDPDRETEEKILDYLEANPDASKRAIRRGVDGRNPTIDDALKSLVGRRIVDVDTSGRAHTHRIAQDPHGHATGTVGHGAGHGSADSEGEHRAREGGGVSTDTPPSGHGPHDSAGENPSTEEGRRCDCGAKIGPTAERCGSCKARELGWT